MLSSMNIGGVEKSLLSLLSIMPKDKYDITILLLEKRGGFLEQVPSWIKVEEVQWFKRVKPLIMQPPKQIIKDFIREQSYLKIPTFIYSYILSEKVFKNRYTYYKQVFRNIPESKENYDIAISYQGPTDIIDYYIGHKVKAKRKISWVHFDVSNHFINQKLYEKLYKRMDKIFVVSKEAQGKLLERIPSISVKTDVFINIISKDIIHKMSQKPVDFDEGYQGIKIVTVGRLTREKGQDLAIKALVKLREKGYEVRWYCIGEGNQRTAYEQMIKMYGLENEFILMGAMTNPYPFMLKADIYVQPSRHEGYCLTLAEAKSLHKPIITTNFIGAFEQIIDGYNGHIVTCDEQKIAEQISDLIEYPKDRELLSINLDKTNVNTAKKCTRLFNNIG